MQIQKVNSSQNFDGRWVRIGEKSYVDSDQVWRIGESVNGNVIVQGPFGQLPVESALYPESVARIFAKIKNGAIDASMNVVNGIVDLIETAKK